MKLFQALSMLMLLLITSVLQAASINWEFTNSNQSWLPGATILMQATLTNIDSTPIELENFINGAGIDPGDFFGRTQKTTGLSGYDLEFLYFFIGVVSPGFLLQPGESIDFTFGQFVPKTSIDPGIYNIRKAELFTFNGQVQSANLFSATVVPIPASILLFISGFLGILGLAKRKVCI